MRDCPTARALTGALVLALALGSGAACEPPPEGRAAGPDAGGADAGGGDAGSDDGYAFVVLPDTQFYSSSWPEIFMAQTRWVVDNRAAEKIAFVLHTGDIVDFDIHAQWGPASAALHVLDGQIPYTVTAGNHDYNGAFADRMGLVNSYFPPSHFSGEAWFG